jgi:(p)ppGpp synthase/HD superfamily hydrolase
MATLEDAVALAALAHAGQFDKSGEPFILHPIRVMLNVPPGPAQQAAVLHDVVEDTPVTLEQLRAFGFDDEVVTAVDHVTRRAGEAYFDFVRRAASHPTARQVERADIGDNSKPDRLSFMGRGAWSMRERYKKALAIVEQAERADVGAAGMDPGE